ncbi:hypothetical protein LCGC14_2148800 [marine sediment metagenome]|uniref:Uncharacterized protein n=1 Tax=marine sediment metagenome TaxID=412755 RepID=A0A0F9EID1_9ZZZZ
MSVGNKIILNSDAGIRVGGVTGWVDPMTPTAVGAATVTGRLYDKKKMRKLTIETDGDGATPTLVSVSSAEPYVDGEPIELQLDDGSLHETTIVSRDTNTDIITLTAAVPAGRKAAAGTFAKRKLGPDISMVLYGGTPAAEQDTWGYRGPVTDVHEGLHLGAKVHCEVEIDDGADRKRVVAFEAIVVEG